MFFNSHLVIFNFSFTSIMLINLVAFNVLQKCRYKHYKGTNITCVFENLSTERQENEGKVTYVMQLIETLLLWLIPA